MISRSIASLSLDLDNEWSYLKTHGDAGWSSFPSYLDIVVPRVLEFLGARDLTITFFIVGQDAALDKNATVLGSIARAGHEIGNHSFHHEPWLHQYSEEAIEQEIALAHNHIARVTGKSPIGFRGPGFSFSQPLLRRLSRHGYCYDASTFPTFVGPLARAYYFMKSDLSRAELRRRNMLFGKLSDGLRPNKPYRFQFGDHELVEIPVTTMPGSRLPIHVSYLLYMAGYSTPAALAYFRSALALCKITNTQPSLLLHPLDFLGCEDNRTLAFFPAMSMPRKHKLRFVGEVIDRFADAFRIVTVAEHAESVLDERDVGAGVSARVYSQVS